MIDIKKLYSDFVIVFIVIFLSSSSFVDPRNWWSIHEVVEIYHDGFSARISLVKVSYYALVSLVVVAILNQPSVRKAIKNALILSLNKIKAFTNVIKTL